MSSSVPGNRHEVVVIEGYDPGWPDRFEQERRRLLQTLRPLGPQIEHIGSTAVSDLCAKPIIDIMLGLGALSDFEPLLPVLESSGWQYHPEHEALIPDRRFLGRPRIRPRSVHLHAVETRGEFWEEHLRFRDLLRADAALAQRYGTLKRALAERHRHDREAYTLAKTDFIHSALARP